MLLGDVFEGGFLLVDVEGLGGLGVVASEGGHLGHVFSEVLFLSGPFEEVVEGEEDAAFVFDLAGRRDGGYDHLQVVGVDVVDGDLSEHGLVVVPGVAFVGVERPGRKAALPVFFVFGFYPEVEDVFDKVVGGVGPFADVEPDGGILLSGFAVFAVDLQEFVNG